MSTGYPNSENKWDAVNDIIRSKYKRNDLHSQTTDLYDMEYIPLSKKSVHMLECYVLSIARKWLIPLALVTSANKIVIKPNRGFLNYDIYFTTGKGRESIYDQHFTMNLHQYPKILP